MTRPETFMAGSTALQEHAEAGIFQTRVFGATEDEFGVLDVPGQVCGIPRVSRAVAVAACHEGRYGDGRQVAPAAIPPRS